MLDAHGWPTIGPGTIPVSSVSSTRPATRRGITRRHLNTETRQAAVRMPAFTSDRNSRGNLQRQHGNQPEPTTAYEADVEKDGKKGGGFNGLLHGSKHDAGTLLRRTPPGWSIE
jgi:hypothetical protein